ncbi:DNA mismatch repair protein MutS [bioreactor metagenome]|uniref:DNA mismatch repair protein MutS n=1 Tax=bioreactor metagenome TaxID=1076179 RepID=A0A644XVL7_9ZZZZ
MNESYNFLFEKFSLESRRLRKVFNWLAFFRLVFIVAFLIAGWFCISHFSSLLLVVTIASLLVFLILMKRQDVIRYRLDLTNALKEINRNEIEFLNSGQSVFYNGEKFLPERHSYAGDLDIFGEFSVYHHLNRTSTVMGRRRLAEKLLNEGNSADIMGVQQAVKELIKETDLRQKIQATGMLAKDSEADLVRIDGWSREVNAPLSLFERILSFAGPVVLLGLIIMSFVTGSLLIQYLASSAFVFNLLMLGKQIKKIKKELSGADKVDSIIKNYSRIAVLIESRDYKSALLQQLQTVPGSGHEKISHQLAKLSRLFRSLESVSNVLAAFLLNGLMQYHVHALHALLVWKNAHAEKLPEWLDRIGEAEALGSLANFAANNPGYAFPQIAAEPTFSFTNLGHPLILSNKRVCNDVSFDNKRFVILTGSNMSGKSTFLRTLGVNMILARAGSPVCASHARIFPVDVLTSIQQSDSLNESESYFFAEVKRLKSIMDAASDKTVFILLDEILRGTNSDDKRNGTMEVIRKLAAINCFGIIATHDLEICNMEPDYPGVLSNMCFEAEIRNDDLFFDYKLRGGVCRNKSATFLMKKMGII